MLHPICNLISRRSDMQIALGCGKMLSRSHALERILSLLRCSSGFSLLLSLNLSNVLRRFGVVHMRDQGANKHNCQNQTDRADNQSRLPT
jgi:hypothetical protein